MQLADKKITLGITGGIAAYKAAELVRLLTQQGAQVQVVMTQAATQFITPVTMQALSGNPVFTDQWDARAVGDKANNMAHINLSREADAIVVAPASADFLAKVAHGLADDLLSTLCLARSCPLLVAPAMNREMWDNVATQRNVAQCRADRVVILGPVSGDQACGEVGMGRMLEAADLVQDLIAYFTPKVFKDRRVLITAGPTYEPIDPVRGITNSSSGKMGFAIARAAAEAGARVTLVTGPTALPTPRQVRRVDVQTAQQMMDEVLGYVNRAEIFIAVAAVADWRVENTSTQKIKKTATVDATLKLVQNPDILATVAGLANPPYCVGFAAESQNLETYVQEKRRAKNVPMMVGNLAQTALGSDHNELLICDEKAVTPLPRASKDELARQLVTLIAKRIG